MSLDAALFGNGVLMLRLCWQNLALTLIITRLSSSKAQKKILESAAIVEHIVEHVADLFLEFTQKFRRKFTENPSIHDLGRFRKLVPA